MTSLIETTTSADATKSTVRTGKYAGARPPSLLGRAGEKANNVGFGELASAYRDHLIAKGDRENSVADAMIHVTHVGRYLEAQGLGLADITEAVADSLMLARIAAGVGDLSRRRTAIYLRAVVKFAVRRKYLSRNRLLDWALPGADQPAKKNPSSDEVWAVMTAIADKNKPETNPCHRNRNRESQIFFTPRDQAMVALGCAALRLGEVVSILPSHMDLVKRQIYLPHTKSGKSRYVSLEVDVIPYLEEWLTARGRTFGPVGDEGALRGLECWRDKEPALFLAENGSPLQVGIWGRQFKRYCAWAKVKDITFHNLRHYSLTELAHEDVTAAKNQAGHGDWRTTMIYHHNSARHNEQHVQAARALGKAIDCAVTKRRTSFIQR